MSTIDASILNQLPLADIESVAFYKRDEITTDLICCEVKIDGKIWFFHEEWMGWSLLLEHVQKLPGFRADWFAAVSSPAFETCETVAFRRV
ncbi:hypothetical protein ACSBOB_17325 [Mesorhizobium sp. ASY16-5R]|uniref:hypothetical protein n=1 Tax=Mesorhizobium sp. ASY16-5R TaxID=3445772 RepID=UPI003FA058AC